MSDLAAWLLDRIAEDELVAEEGGEWFPTDDETDEPAVAEVGVGGVTWKVGLIRNAGDAGHIARWDPARVLAECDAKRRIVALHRAGGLLGNGQEFCATCGSGEPYEYPTTWPCGTLKLLALPYADQPGWREEWRP